MFRITFLEVLWHYRYVTKTPRLLFWVELSIRLRNFISIAFASFCYHLCLAAVQYCTFFSLRLLFYHIKSFSSCRLFFGFQLLLPNQLVKVNENSQIVHDSLLLPEKVIEWYDS